MRAVPKGEDVSDNRTNINDLSDANSGGELNDSEVAGISGGQGVGYIGTTQHLTLIDTIHGDNSTTQDPL